jgi:DNA-directed RNA polymerase specialized sigma24 family protein
MFPPPDLDDRQLEALYTRHFCILTEIATAEFHIPKPDAEELAHDILMASFKQSSRIDDADAWFRGAMTHAARTYARKRA